MAQEFNERGQHMLTVHAHRATAVVFKKEPLAPTRHRNMNGVGDAPRALYLRAQLKRVGLVAHTNIQHPVLACVVQTLAKGVTTEKVDEVGASENHKGLRVNRALCLYRGGASCAMPLLLLALTRFASWICVICKGDILHA